MEDRNLVKIDTDKCVIELNNSDEDSTKRVKSGILSKIPSDFLRNIMHEINRNKNGIYQIAYFPKGGNITQNADGTITAVFRDESGKILEHGKLKSVGHDIANISKSVANQIMLMYVVAQLNEVIAKLDFIIKGQHDDRISEIEGAIKTYNSLSLEDKSDINKTLDIVNQINTGISKLDRELKSHFIDIDPKAKFSDNWISDKNQMIEKKHEFISDAVYWIIKGYEVLIEWDINCNVKKDDKNSIDNFIQFLEKYKWEELRLFARALPVTQKESKNIFPEEIWENLHNVKESQLKNNKNEIEEYAISANGNKFLEVLNEL